ncbi:MAG: hypothetical protein Fur003_5440 [Candidatus Dojkabacteria bacterium]
MPVKASSDFEITTDYIIKYQNNADYVTVNESVTIDVNTSQYYLPAGTVQEFEIPDFDPIQREGEREFKLDSISITDGDGKKLAFQSKEQTTGINVTVKQPVNITPSEPYTMTLSYKTHELFNKNGNIVNLYIPGLPKDTPFTHKDSKNNLITTFKYNTSLQLIGDTPEVSYMQPAGIKASTSGNTKVYTLTQQQRLGQSAWLQLGTKQYYYFKIVQNSPKTDNLTPEELSKVADYLSTNVFTLPLPRNYDETKQNVLIKSISPQPTSIESDTEGNLTALFEVPANRSTEIVIEGYLSLDNSTTKEVPEIDLDQYLKAVKSDQKLATYLKADKYWESNNQAIISKSDEIIKDAATINDYITAVYQSTIDTLEYDTSKVTGENKRNGALAALNGAPAVCMEYSDLAVALLRAQGVPARAAVGYGNDPTGVENNISNEKASVQQIGHQWVQVWIPDYGWYSIDPTWGESGRTYLGTNLDHLLWYTLGSSEQESLGGTSLSSADSVSKEDFEAYQVYIQALSQEQFDSLSQDTVGLSEYLADYSDSNYSPFTYFLKTTIVGRALIVSLPIILLIIFFTTIATFIVRVKRGKLTRKETTS